MPKTPTADRADRPAADSAIAKLAELGAALAAVADDEGARIEKLDAILDQIKTLDDDDRRALLKHQVVRDLVDAALEADRPSPAGDRPGSVKGFVKKYWTWKDLETMPRKTGMSPITQQFFWNGLPWRFEANEEFDCPEVFYGLLQDHIRNVRSAHEHAAWLFAHRNQVSDPTIIGPDSQRVRATGQADQKQHFQPGGGIVANPMGRGAEAAGGEVAEAAGTGSAA